MDLQKDALVMLRGDEFSSSFSPSSSTRFKPQMYEPILEPVAIPFQSNGAEQHHIFSSSVHYNPGLMSPIQAITPNILTVLTKAL